MTELTVFIPLVTRSEANLREHWALRARRAKRQREAAMVMTRVAVSRQGRVAEIRNPATALRVRLVRCTPRSLDTDNLARALKAVRDGVADALGRDDGDPGITWEYGQLTGAAWRAHPYGVGVEVTIGIVAQAPGLAVAENQPSVASAARFLRPRGMRQL